MIGYIENKKTHFDRRYRTNAYKHFLFMKTHTRSTVVIKAIIVNLNDTETTYLIHTMVVTAAIIMLSITVVKSLHVFRTNNSLYKLHDLLTFLVHL